MNIQMPRPSAHQAWDEVRTRLDQNSPLSNMHDTPYYRDAVYDHFSKQEYQRRYRALRDNETMNKARAMMKAVAQAQVVVDLLGEFLEGGARGAAAADP